MVTAIHSVKKKNSLSSVTGLAQTIPPPHYLFLRGRHWNTHNICFCQKVEGCPGAGPGARSTAASLPATGCVAPSVKPIVALGKDLPMTAWPSTASSLVPSGFWHLCEETTPVATWSVAIASVTHHAALKSCCFQNPSWGSGGLSCVSRLLQQVPHLLAG